MAWGRFFAEQGGSGQGFGTFLVCCRFFVFGCNARYMTHGGDARQDGTSFNGETRAFWRDKRRRRGIWGFGGWGLVAATDGGNREKQQRTATTHGGASPPWHKRQQQRRQRRRQRHRRCQAALGACPVTALDERPGTACRAPTIETTMATTGRPPFDGLTGAKGRPYGRQRSGPGRVSSQ